MRTVCGNCDSNADLDRTETNVENELGVVDSVAVTMVCLSCGATHAESSYSVEPTE